MFRGSYLKYGTGKTRLQHFSGTHFKRGAGKTYLNLFWFSFIPPPLPPPVCQGCGRRRSAHRSLRPPAGPLNARNVVNYSYTPVQKHGTGKR